MHKIYVNLPLYIPNFAYRSLKKFKEFLRPNSKINLLGDRDIEWSWIASQMPKGFGKALDFGSGGSYLGLIAAEAGYDVTAIDQQPITWPYHHPNLHFIQGDILKLQLSDNSFDLIINCSVIEHVGLSGRYGVTEDFIDGDLDAMHQLKALLKPSGIMLLTIPIGQDAVFPPLHRVYGKERLTLLLNNFLIKKEQYWIIDITNKWVLVTKNEAINIVPKTNLYGLGCFQLALKRN